MISTVRLKTKLSIFQNKTTTKSQQNHKKITTVLFCCDFVLFCFDYVMFYCFELENSLNSGNLLSDYITSL